MGKLIFGMNQSLDGYVDGASGQLELPPPSARLFDHWVEHVRGIAGSLYGRRMYEVMRYWDHDDPDWSEPRRAFAAAWRAQPKWVVSNTLSAVGPNATLVTGDIEAQVRQIKARTPGTLSVAGPEIAGYVGNLGLIDEYHLYLHPHVLGGGKPFFHGARPSLRFVSSEMVDDVTVRLVYARA